MDQAKGLGKPSQTLPPTNQKIEKIVEVLESPTSEDVNKKVDEVGTARKEDDKVVGVNTKKAVGDLVRSLSPGASAAVVPNDPEVKVVEGEAVSSSSAGALDEDLFVVEDALPVGPVYMEGYRPLLEWQLSKYCEDVTLFKLREARRSTYLVVELLQTMVVMKEEDFDLAWWHPVKYESLGKALVDTKGTRLHEIYFVNFGDKSGIEELDNLVMDISNAYRDLNGTFIGLVDYEKGVTDPTHVKCVIFFLWMEKFFSVEINCPIDLKEPLVANITDVILGLNNFVLENFGKGSWTYIRMLRLNKEKEEQGKKDEEEMEENKKCVGFEEMEKVQLSAGANE